MRMDEGAVERTLLRAGFLLVLLALVTGLAVQLFRNPRNPPPTLVVGSSYRLTLYDHVNGGDGIMAFTILKP